MFVFVAYATDSCFKLLQLILYVLQLTDLLHA